MERREEGPEQWWGEAGRGNKDSGGVEERREKNLTGG